MQLRRSACIRLTSLILASTFSLAFANGPPSTLNVTPPSSAPGFAKESIDYGDVSCSIPSTNGDINQCSITYNSEAQLTYNKAPINMPSGNDLQGCNSIAVGFAGLNQGCTQSGGTGCTEITGVGYIKINGSGCGG